MFRGLVETPAADACTLRRVVVQGDDGGGLHRAALAGQLALQKLPASIREHHKTIHTFQTVSASVHYDTTHLGLQSRRGRQRGSSRRSARCSTGGGIREVVVVMVHATSAATGSRGSDGVRGVVVYHCNH